MRDVAGAVASKRLDAEGLRVTAWDGNGYEREVLDGDASAVRLLRDCVYYVIGREQGLRPDK